MAVGSDGGAAAADGDDAMDEVDPEAVAGARQPGGTLMVPGAAFVDAIAAHVDERVRVRARFVEKRLRRCGLEAMARR